MAYTHLSLAERHCIEVQLTGGASQNKVAKLRGGPKPLFPVSWAVIPNQEATVISKHTAKRKSVTTKNASRLRF